MYKAIVINVPMRPGECDRRRSRAQLWSDERAAYPLRRNPFGRSKDPTSRWSDERSLLQLRRKTEPSFLLSVLSIR